MYVRDNCVPVWYSSSKRKTLTIFSWHSRCPLTFSEAWMPGAVPWLCLSAPLLTLPGLWVGRQSPGCHSQASHSASVAKAVTGGVLMGRTTRAVRLLRKVRKELQWTWFFHFLPGFFSLPTTLLSSLAHPAQYRGQKPNSISVLHQLSPDLAVSPSSLHFMKLFSGCGFPTCSRS